MKALGAYFALGRVAWREAAACRAELFGRSVFLAVLLGIFTALWRAIDEAGMPLAGDRHRLVWYLAATEWVLLSAPPRHLEIQEEVRRGDVAYQLSRPISYPRAAFAYCVGALLLRAPVLAVAAFAAAWSLTGALPNTAGLLWLIPAGLLGAVVLAELYVALGLLSFWLSDASPLYWVASKLLFVLGGLMLPIELYPSWLQRIAWCTPFPALLSAPAAFVLQPPQGTAVTLLRLLLWGLVLFAVTELLFWRARRAMSVNGG